MAKFSTGIKISLLIILGLQSQILIQSNSEFFQINLIIASFTFAGIIIQLIINNDLFKFIKTRSIEVLFYMNTTILMACLINKDGIYNQLIKESLHKIIKKVDGE